MIVFTGRTLFFLLQIFTFVLFFLLLLLLLNYSLLCLWLSWLLLLLCHILRLRNVGGSFTSWILMLQLRTGSLIWRLRRRHIIFIWVNISCWSFIETSLLLFHLFSNSTVKSDTWHSTLGSRFGRPLIGISVPIMYFKVNCTDIDPFTLWLVALDVSWVPRDSLFIHDYLFLRSKCLCLRVNKKELSLIVHLVREVCNEGQKSNGDASHYRTLRRKYLDGPFVLRLFGILEGRGCIFDDSSCWWWSIVCNLGCRSHWGSTIYVEVWILQKSESQKLMLTILNCIEGV